MEDVLENPSIDDRPGPNGIFVVVGLDPIASVAAMQDERATEAAAAMPKSKYLGIIDTLGHAGVELDAGLPKMEYTFFCVGHGLPPDEDSAVAIHPAVGTSSRPALIPSNSLPWSDCYVHTVQSFEAVISRVYKRAPTNAALSRADLRTLTGYATRDEIRTARATNAAAAARAPPPTDENENDAPASEHSHHTSDYSESSGGSSDDSRESPTAALGPERPPSPYRPQRMDIHMEMWLDLHADHELSDPKLLVSQFEQLKRIEKEWAERIAHDVVTKRPRTSAWLDGIAAAGELDNSAALHVNDGAEAEDVDIGPEDAIEHRLERAEKDAKGYPPSRPGPSPHDEYDGARSRSTWRIFAFAARASRAVQALASRVLNSMHTLVRRIVTAMQGRSSDSEKAP
ncbi:hypothetical protein EXIGLDRAFT_736177 [Exidia glandulosa HHB12029]|uniref:Uncharacterized protein n=1 Tax=Exidia glandulosa HHB12029 TaxID=1314781 RepID=A0A165JJX9_EXIGL|nr:hypothetical protein EXIGLDRAFT_736177 [Exidia glandulosa HHB12029]